MANKYEIAALLFGMAIAKKLTLRVWKKDFVPTFEQWLRELANTLCLERLRYYNEDKMNMFGTMWDAVLKSLQ